MPRSMLARTVRSPARSVLLLVIFGGCEIEEITVVDVEDVVIAEVYVNLAKDPGDNEVLGFLHRTVGTDIEGVADLVAAELTLRRSDGLTFSLRNAAASDCVETLPEGEEGACFFADSVAAAQLTPGDLLALDVALPDGRELGGATRIPGSFDLLGVGGACILPPDTRSTLEWTRADEAWAYVNETSINGLPAALRSEGIVLQDDPLYLLGLSVSDSDTTIVFPSEFGVFNRFELDQDVAVRLQRGLPAGVSARVTISAVDRNYVNWARGGNFNPSGQVRIASLRGDGTGVFASTVVRGVNVTVLDEPGGQPACPVESG
ncbi:MAG: hypothetical protein OEN56_00120 [Gemmatimonadota bacterium]|nr:hypothetical protein [Gemmatimonadota bacterium]